MTQDTITALKPTVDPFEPAWSSTTLAGILAESPTTARPAAPWWRATRRRTVAFVASGVVVLSAGAAVAGGGPVDVVRDAIIGFSQEPNTTGNNLGELHDPELVAQFQTDHGLFAVWLATSSTGKVCTAHTDGTWDGQGVPTKSDLSSYGCGGEIVAHDGSVTELTRPDQIGGFFKDDAGPIVYGVSAYPDAVEVRLQGTGIDRTLPLRPDSHGFGAAIPEAADADALTLTFLDASGAQLGSERWVAPVG